MAALLAAMNQFIPSEILWDNDGVPQAFAFAAMHRCGDLLKGELELCRLGHHSITRVLGRALNEMWLRANHLLLCGFEAIEWLGLEDEWQQGLVERGHRILWDEVERFQSSQVDLSDPDFARRPFRAANLEALSNRVRDLRKEAGFDSEVATVQYQMHYRWDSARDVHSGVGVIARYLKVDTPKVFVLSMPGLEDVTEMRGPSSVHWDAQLVADVWPCT